MKITKGIQSIIEAAKLRGFLVDISDTDIDIYKKTSTGKVTKGIRICENGWAYRMDIDLGSTTWIKSQKSMREVLEL